MDKVEVAKQQIEKIIKNSDCINTYDKEKDPTHSKKTLGWVLKLNPNACDELQIAALGHDIDRAIESRRIKSENFNDYEAYKMAHAKKSARIVAEILHKLDFNNNFIERVKILIEQHEIGGDPDIDTLMEADSLSFFNWDITFYIKAKGEQKTMDKIKFMYSRMSDKAKALVQEIEYKDSKIGDLVKLVIDEMA